MKRMSVNRIMALLTVISISTMPFAGIADEPLVADGCTSFSNLRKANASFAEMQAELVSLREQRDTMNGGQVVDNT